MMHFLLRQSSYFINPLEYVNIHTVPLALVTSENRLTETVNGVAIIQDVTQLEEVGLQHILHVSSPSCTAGQQTTECGSSGKLDYAVRGCDSNVATDTQQHRNGRPEFAHGVRGSCNRDTASCTSNTDTCQDEHVRPRHSLVSDRCARAHEAVTATVPPCSFSSTSTSVPVNSNQATTVVGEVGLLRCARSGPGVRVPTPHAGEQEETSQQTSEKAHRSEESRAGDEASTPSCTPANNDRCRALQSFMKQRRATLLRNTLLIDPPSSEQTAACQRSEQESPYRLVSAIEAHHHTNTHHSMNNSNCSGDIVEVSSCTRNATQADSVQASRRVTEQRRGRAVMKRLRARLHHFAQLVKSMQCIGTHNTHVKQVDTADMQDSTEQQRAKEQQRKQKENSNNNHHLHPLAAATASGNDDCGGPRNIIGGNGQEVLQPSYVRHRHNLFSENEYIIFADDLLSKYPHLLYLFDSPRKQNGLRHSLITMCESRVPDSTGENNNNNHFCDKGTKCGTKGCSSNAERDKRSDAHSESRSQNLCYEGVDVASGALGRSRLWRKYEHSSAAAEPRYSRSRNPFRQSSATRVLRQNDLLMNNHPHRCMALHFADADIVYGSARYTSSSPSRF